jgi:hypothetical protein
MDLKATILAAIDQYEAEMAYTIGGLRQQVTDKETALVAAAQRELIKDSAISDLRAQIAELTKPTPPPVVTPPPVTTVPVSTWPTIAGTKPQGTLVPMTTRPVSGQVYVGKSFKGTVDLRGITNVKFIDCLFDAAGSIFGVRCDDGIAIDTARVFDRCEFRNASDDNVYGGGFTAKGCYCTESGGDHFKVKSYFKIIGCYAEKFGKNTGAHGDFVQCIGHSHGLIEGCYIDGTLYNTNAALMIQEKSDGTVPKNVTFRRNFVDGGAGNMNYAINGRSDTATCIAEYNTFKRGSMKYGNSQGAMKWGAGNVDEKGLPTTAGTK